MRRIREPLKVSLARRMLTHEWNRFVPAALAVAFCGVLLVVQAALVLGIFSTASVYVSGSSADLWLGYPGTQSVELGRPIPQLAELRALMDPAVARVERFQWLDGDWRGSRDRGAASVVVSGIDPGREGLLFAKVLSPDMRARLAEPDTIIVDVADRDKLGLGPDRLGEINGHRVRLVGSVRGIRALGAINIVTSLATARTLGAPAAGARSVTYVLARLRDGFSAPAVRDRLRKTASANHYAVWTSDEFSRRVTTFWLFDTGAGVGFLFAGIVIVAVAVIITSQIMMSVVAGSIREYATLRALGVGKAGVRKVTLEQAGWIGACGVVVASLLSAAIVALARWQLVPVAVTATMALACAALVLIVAMMAGLAAARSLRNADPGMLLR